MAAVLERVRPIVRRHDITPALNAQERAELYGIQAVPTQRASRQPQRKRVRRDSPKTATTTIAVADVQDYDDENNETPLPTTDSLQQNPETGPQRIVPIRKYQSTKGYGHTQHPRSFWINALLGALGLVAGYTVLFFIILGCFRVMNTALYGPTYTYYTTATINAQPTEIVTSNVHGTIYVTLINLKDSTTKTYTGPLLNTQDWNDNLSSIVATAQVTGNQQTPKITIHMVGDISYFHLLFVRPESTFYLIPDSKGNYTVSS